MSFLAAIPNNPELYNPLKHFDKTKSTGTDSKANGRRR
ncbi:hypothetical protein ACFWMS_20610 [Peribacillus butanolivorans]